MKNINRLKQEKEELENHLILLKRRILSTEDQIIELDFYIINVSTEYSKQLYAKRLYWK